MASDTDSDLSIPRQARKFLADVQQHEQVLREEMKERLSMYIGGKLQWDVRERNRRDAQNRPYISINEIKPPIQQIETDIRLNPPGPVCHPVGGGADDDTADIIEGTIRGTEYQCDAKGSYIMAGTQAAISGYGVIEWGTRYVDETSVDQELYVIPNQDPSRWYFDMLATKKDRSDAMVALKGPIVMSRAAYEEEFGKNRKVLQRDRYREMVGNAQTMFGWEGDAANLNMWTTNGKGPFWVANFWKVEISSEKGRVYSDNVFRLDSDFEGEYPLDLEGNPIMPKGWGTEDESYYERDVPKRKVMKYVVDAFEVLAKTEWIGDTIPARTVLGPETYIDGKLHRSSLVAGMIDPQRALNYAATSMMEIAGKVTRAPWIGTKGQFDDIGDDGVNKWETAATEDHAWLAVEPVTMIDEATGRTTFAPLPQRNMMEAAIQWTLQLAQFFKDAIQAASAYSATSLGKRTADQSGEAIRALQAEASKGTFSYPDELNSSVASMYHDWVKIFPKIMDSARAQTIIRADGQQEQALINQFFDDPSGELDEQGSAKQKKYDFTIGRYSVRVDAGPSLETRNLEATAGLDRVFHAAPGLLEVPGVAAAYVRLIGDGNPRVEQIADMLPGGEGDKADPAQIQQQNQQLQAQLKTVSAMLQKAQMDLATDAPKLELDKYKANLDAAVKLATAEMSTKAQTDARVSADALEVDLTHKQMAHDVAMQADSQEHQAAQAEQQRAVDAEAAAQGPTE